MVEDGRPRRIGETGEVPSDRLDRLEDVGRVAVKVAASAVVASSLASALADPPDPASLTLPDPVPIVRQYEVFDQDAIPDDDEEQDEASSRWLRLRKVLRYLLMALAVTAALFFGVLKGCAGVAGSLLLPPADDERQEQRAAPAPAQDERGVPLGQ